jgi:P-type Mg2+ transporter
MVPIVFFVNGYTKGDWLQAFLFALSVAVGLTPEMLPMIVTSTLAKGAVRLSRRQVVVKRLDAIQNFGAMGAVEEVLAICTQVRTQEPTDASLDGARTMPTVPLDAALRARTQAVTAGLNAQGLRMVAVAVKTLPPSQATHSVTDESGLTLIGYIAFLDPPKESAAPALKKLAAHGITVKVLSGDNDLVTAHVCKQVGLPATTVLLGTQVEALSDTDLKAAAEAHHVFAKLTPLHKERIVRALRAGGHVVGFMGDGINDAPALRAADIGISVDSAVDIAKEAADIILLEKSLRVLDEGVVEGRMTFCNMLKYIRMTASSNFGNVLSVLVASAFLPFLPMLPLQLLVQNLLYDIGQTGIPFDNVDPELVSRPLKWNPVDIGRFMLFFGPISSLFDMVTFAVMWWVFDANSVARQGLFQPLARYFSLQALPPAYYGWLAAILLGYCALTTLMKRYYIGRYGWQ